MHLFMYASMLSLQTWRMGSAAQSLLHTCPVSGCPVRASSSQSVPKDPSIKVEDDPLVSLTFSLFLFCFSLKHVITTVLKSA